jgi:hypothetical protein
MIMKTGIILIAVLLILSVSCKKNSSKTTTNYPTEGLISYFNFDENLKDQQGNTPDGVYNGSATYVTGIHGNAVSFNGSNQYITFARQTYKSGNNISVSLWFKTHQSGMAYLAICSDFALFKNATGLNAGISISTPMTNAAYGNYTEDSWTHLVGTYDGTNIRVYINGNFIQSVNYPGTISDPHRDLSVGYYNTNYYEGAVDELYIYNRALTQDDVTKLFNAH